MNWGKPALGPSATEVLSRLTEFLESVLSQAHSGISAPLSTLCSEAQGAAANSVMPKTHIHHRRSVTPKKPVSLPLDWLPWMPFKRTPSGRLASRSCHSGLRREGLGIRMVFHAALVASDCIENRWREVTPAVQNRPFQAVGATAHRDPLPIADGLRLRRP